MEKVAQFFLLTIFIFCANSNAFAQENTVIKKGLLRAHSTLCTGKNLKHNISNFYLHGVFEGYLEKTVSVAGEAYYYLGELNAANELFEFNHSLFFGASKHFVKNKNDFYIGLQPGVSITKMNSNYITFNKTDVGVNPLFSGVVGYNLYVSNFFHFFIQSRIIVGNHNYDKQINLTEIRCSAGLGLNLNSIK